MGNRRPFTGIAVAVCAALLLSLVMAPAAMAGFKTGRYAGTTSQGEPIRFKATEVLVKKFDFLVTADCEDGSAVTVSPDKDVKGAKAAISNRGRFTATFIGTTVVAGKLKRRNAEGTITVSALNPDTGASCSGTVDWSAKRQKQG